MSKEIIQHETPATGQLQQVGAQALTAPASTTPAAVLMHVMSNGGSIEQIEKMLDVQLKWEANEARKAYVADMAEFKKNPPTILKDKAVGYKDKNNNLVGYTHATLGNVTNAIVEGLARNGFSHCWDVRQDGHLVSVTCRITHCKGHSEEVSMAAGKDDSGKKNAIQQVASTITYLQRYTLLAATGLATHDQADDDGDSAEPAVNLAEKWVAAAKSARSLVELEDVWGCGAKEIREADDGDAYQQFKDACNARKTALGGGAPAQPGRSSRVASIIGGNGNQQSAQAGE